MTLSIYLGVLVFVLGSGLYVYARANNESMEMRRATIACTIGSSSALFNSADVELIGGGQLVEFFYLVGIVIGYGMGVHYLLKHHSAYRYVLPR